MAEAEKIVDSLFANAGGDFSTLFDHLEEEDTVPAQEQEGGFLSATYGTGQQIVGGALQTIGDVIDKDDSPSGFGSSLEQYGSGLAQRGEERLATVPEGASKTLGGLAGSVGLSVPAMAAAAFGAPVTALGLGGAAIGTAVLSSGGDKYREALELGKDEDTALTAGVLSGGVEAIGALPLGRFLKIAKGGAGNGFSEQLLKAMRDEGIEEGTVNVVNEAVDAGLLDKDITFAEALVRTGQAAALGSVGGAMGAGTAKVINVGATKIRGKGTTPTDDTAPVEEIDTELTVDEALQDIVENSNQSPTINRVAKVVEASRSLEDAKSRLEAAEDEIEQRDLTLEVNKKQKIYDDRLASIAKDDLVVGKLRERGIELLPPEAAQAVAAEETVKPIDTEAEQLQLALDGTVDELDLFEEPNISLQLEELSSKKEALMEDQAAYELVGSTKNVNNAKRKLSELSKKEERLNKQLKNYREERRLQQAFSERGDTERALKHKANADAISDKFAEDAAKKAAVERGETPDTQLPTLTQKQRAELARQEQEKVAAEEAAKEQEEVRRADERRAAQMEAEPFGTDIEPAFGVDTSPIDADLTQQQDLNLDEPPVPTRLAPRTTPEGATIPVTEDVDPEGPFGLQPEPEPTTQELQEAGDLTQQQDVDMFPDEDAPLPVQEDGPRVVPSTSGGKASKLSGLGAEKIAKQFGLGKYTDGTGWKVPPGKLERVQAAVKESDGMARKAKDIPSNPTERTGEISPEAIVSSVEARMPGLSKFIRKALASQRISSIAYDPDINPDYTGHTQEQGDINGDRWWKISINPNTDPDIIEESIAHEMVHAATASFMQDMRLKKVTVTGETANALLELKRLHEEVKSNHPDTWKDTNFGKDVEEFMAWAMSNRTAQEQLKAMPTSKNMNAFQKFVHSLAKFIDSVIGSKFSRTALEDVVDITKTVMKDQSKMGPSKVTSVVLAEQAGMAAKGRPAPAPADARITITDSNAKERFATATGVAAAVDVFNRSPITAPIAKAIESYVNAKQRNAGAWHKSFEDAFKVYDAAYNPAKGFIKTEHQDKMDDLVRQWAEARIAGNVTLANKIKNSDPEFKKAANSIEQSLDMAGAEAERLGVVVQFPNKVKRKFKRQRNYFPLMLDAKWKDALKKADTGNKKFEEFVAAYVKATGKTDAEARAKLKEYAAANNQKGTESMFGNIEQARVDPLPMEFYDLSFATLGRYGHLWAQRMAQVEAFEQGRSKREGTLFDQIKNDKQLTGDSTEYIREVQEALYGTETGYLASDPATALAIISTGMQLSNPISAAVNLLGGGILTQVYFGNVKTAKGFSDLMSDFKALSEEAAELGIIREDFANIVADADLTMAGSVASTLTGVMLQVGQYNRAERAARMLAMATARRALLDAQKKPNKQFNRMAKTHDLPANILLNPKHKDYQKVYRDYLRKMVNVTQGSYELDRTPLWVSSAGGKFLFKYSKFAVQTMKMLHQRIAVPYANAETKREKIEIVAEALMLAVTAAAMGGAMKDILEWFGGRMEKPDPSTLEIAEKLVEDGVDITDLTDTVMWLYGGLSMIGMTGTLGMFADGINRAEDKFRKQGEFRLAPPAPPLSLAEDVLNGVLKIAAASDLEGGAAEETANLFRRTVGFYRGYEQLLSKYEKLPPNLTDHGEWINWGKDKNWGQEKVRRYEAVMGYDREGSYAPSDNRYSNRRLEQFLATGQRSLAIKEINQRLADAANTKERGSVKTSIKNSLAHRHPFAVFGDSKGRSAVERELFRRWAENNLADYEYERLIELKDRYEDMIKQLPLQYRPDLKTPYAHEIRKYMKENDITMEMIQ